MSNLINMYKSCSFVPNKDLPELNIEYLKKIDLFKFEWTSFINNVPQIKSSIPWRDIMLDNNLLNINLKKKLHSLRANLNNLLNDICVNTVLKSSTNFKYCDDNDSNINKSKCFAFGSDKLESDIDVTISGNCMSANLLILKVIKKTLISIFNEQEIFKDNGNFHLSNVHRFFDINYYLTDFFIKRDKSMPDNELSSYFITTHKSQYRFAFFEYLKLHHQDNECNEEIIYDDLSFDIDKLIKSAKRDFKNDIFTDKLLEKISSLSLYQDECYHTQGSFFHVVLLMQAKLEYLDINNNLNSKFKYRFLIEQSLIENLCFSITHFHRKDKYLKRVFDAYNRLDSESILKSFLNSNLGFKNDVNYINSIINSDLQTLISMVERLKAYLINNKELILSGGNKSFKKLLKDGISVKKLINGRDRVIYVDNTRKQFYKQNNTFKRINQK